MLNPWPPAYLPGEPELLHDVLRRNELAGRQCHYTSRLEGLWSAHTGARYAVATNSGTAALTLAFRGLRADPGDEVIVPAFTFIASALAAVHAGLVPRFCDVRPDTYGIDLTHAETLVTEHTQAIVVVHLNGVPADLAQARRLADRHELALIEDACQAHGARWNDQPVGDIGFAGTFSFNRSKNLPAGEGGMVVTDSEDAFGAALAAFQFGEPPARLRAAGITASRWQDRVLPEHRVFTDGLGHGCPWRCHHRPAPARADVPIARRLAGSMIWLEDAIAPTNGEAQLTQVAEIIHTTLREVRDATTHAHRIGSRSPGRLP
ncbi:MAG: DegT/DnrJ/EryC1/StrS family aminotransferase [Pseudonocardiaceae bacterium]